MDNIQKILDNASLRNIDELKQRIVSFEGKLSKNDIKYLRNQIIKGKKIDRICAALLIYVYYCSDKAIYELRRKGLFSYWNNFDDVVYNVEKLSRCLVEQSDWLNISLSNKIYLNKKIQYSWMGDWLLKTQENIDYIIRKHYENRKSEKYNGVIYETSLYRELISYVDFSFLATNNNVSDDSNMNVLNSYSKEAIASAVSFLIYRYESVIGIPKDNDWIDADYVTSDEMDQLILMACKFLCLREWELFWDYYNYSVSDEGVIYSEDEFFEKAFVWGISIHKFKNSCLLQQNLKHWIRKNGQHCKCMEKC